MLLLCCFFFPPVEGQTNHSLSPASLASAPFQTTQNEEEAEVAAQEEHIPQALLERGEVVH